MTRVYLDHSATTPLDPAVKSAMDPFWDVTFGNPTSIHTFGQEAAAGVDRARAQLAAFLGCEVSEIIFTSGATESDNLAVKGVIAAVRKQGINEPHIVTSLIEHDAVLEPCLELENSGVSTTYIKVKSNGVLDLAHLAASIKPTTALVSIMWVNSEVGAVQPIKAVGELVRAEREKRQREGNAVPIYFHTDATQAINFYHPDVNRYGIDLLSLSAHKIYGPKGVGVLYCRKVVPLLAQTRGGHQENNRRSGTLNATGIVGLGAAVLLLGEKTDGENTSTIAQSEQNAKIAFLRDTLVEGLIKAVPDASLNTDRPNATPAHAHFSFLGVEGEAALLALDIDGIAVSTGSACASGSLKASHVLLAMGIDKEVAHYSIRMTLGRHTNSEDIEYVLKTLPPIITRLRAMNPIYGKPNA